MEKELKVAAKRRIPFSFVALLFFVFGVQFCFAISTQDPLPTISIPIEYDSPQPGLSSPQFANFGYDTSLNLLGCTTFLSSGSSLFEKISFLDFFLGQSGRATTDFLTDVTVKSRGKVIGQVTVDLRTTLNEINSGKLQPRDVFQNRENLLPTKPSGYYQEFYKPTPGFSKTGPERIIRGSGGELYYTPDHYQTFIPLN